MNWFIISVVSYFFNALAAIVDKFLLKKDIPYPVVYAFYVSLMGGAVIFLIPFGFSWPGLYFFFLAMIAGISFTFAVLLFYIILQKGDVSKVAPAIGGMIPVFILILAGIILGENLAVKQIIGFFVIVLGSFLISKERSYGKSFSSKTILFSVLSSFLFALSYVLTKVVYVNHSFVSGLIWRGLGSVLGGLLLLGMVQNRRRVIHALRDSKIQTGFLFFFGQGVAAIAFVLLNYAFSLGPIALVNALIGIQYFFLFLMVILLSKKYPNVLKETLAGQKVFMKILGLIILSSGIFLLFV